MRKRKGVDDLKRITNAIVDLFKVKTILSLAVVGTTCYLAIVEKLELSTFIALASSIITYYFTREKDKDKGGIE